MGRENTKKTILPPYQPNDGKEKSKPKDGLILVKEHRRMDECVMPGMAYKRYVDCRPKKRRSDNIEEGEKPKSGNKTE